MAWNVIPQAPEYEAENKGSIRYAETKIEIPQTLRTDKTRYLWVLLLNSGFQEWLDVGTAVASAYYGLPLPGETLNYIDGNTRNNNKNNLEWI